MLIRHISVSHVDSVQEMFDHVFIINFIPILTCLSDFFIVLLVNKQASNSWHRHFPTSQTCTFNIQLYAVTISLRQFTFNNQYNYHYRIKMMAFLHPCSLTEKFIIVSVNTNINMVGFRVLYLYDVLIQPSSNIHYNLLYSNTNKS